MSNIKKALLKKYGDAYFGSAPPQLHRISTGYVGLDYILGGGLPVGRIVQIAARPSHGKSTTCLCVARNLINQGYSVAYIDLERTCDSARLAQIGIDTSEDNELFHYIRPADGETALEFAVEVAAMGVKLVIIDSIPNIIPRTVMESDVGKQSYSPVAKLLSSEYSKLVSAFETAQSTLILINQLREKVGSMFGGTTTPGGYAIKHAFSIMIDMYRSKEASDGASYQLNYNTSKNKTFREKLNTQMVYYKDDRLLCPYSSLIFEAVNAGLVKQAGAYYKLIGYDELATTIDFDLKSETIGQGKERAIETIKNNSKLYEYLYKGVMEFYGLSHQSNKAVVGSGEASTSD